MKVKPLRDNVLVSPDKKEEKTKTDSGIYLPETTNSEERPQAGKIVEIGESDEIKVKKNDKIIFSRYAGTKVDVDGEEFMIIKNEDILAVIEK